MPNPNGQQIAKVCRDALRKIAVEQDKSGLRCVERVMRKLVRAAEGGDVHAIREFMDRLDGRVAHQVGGDTELGPISIKWKD